MKVLASVVASTTMAMERAFADNPTFMAQTEAFWSAPWFNHEDYLQNTKDALPTLISAFDGERKVQNRFARDMNKLVENIEDWNARCKRQNPSGRKRRTVDDSQRVRRSKERLYAYGDLEKDFKGVWWQFAKYTRNEMEATCPDQAWRLYKRIDRYRWIYMNKYCAIVDMDADFCSWAFYSSNGLPFRGTFRKMGWFNKKFGREVPRPTQEPPNPFPLPEGYTEHETAWGKVYTKIYDDFYTSAEAHDLCAGDSAFTHLPAPQNRYENEFFLDLVGPRSDRDMWLGINDVENEGVWTNIFGETQSYFNWNKNEPNNFGKNGEHHVEMLLSGTSAQNGLWNDMFDHASTQDNRVNYSNNNLVVCTFTVPGTAPPSKCDLGYEVHTTSEGEKCLQVNKGKFQFDYALSQCQDNGARLVQPQNQSDNDLYASLVGFQKYDLWIAANDVESEGSWVDANDGSAITWFNWNKNEPNNHGSGEHYVTIILTDGDTLDDGRNGLWNDIRSHNHANQQDKIAYGQNNAFICSKDVNEL